MGQTLVVVYIIYHNESKNIFLKCAIGAVTTYLIHNSICEYIMTLCGMSNGICIITQCNYVHCEYLSTSILSTLHKYKKLYLEKRH